MQKIAVVSGASRGLGLGAARSLAERGFHVFLGVRNPDKARKDFDALLSRNLKVEMLKLDVADEKSVQDFKQQFQKRFDRLDVLINNAGIFIDDQDGGDKSVLKTKAATVAKTFQTNALGAFLLTQSLWPFLVENGSGRVVNVSSGMGQLSEMGGNHAAYRISKTAMNAVTKIFSQEGSGKNILVNSVCPGWVKTDMGGANATRSLAEGVRSILWAASLEDNGPTGGFYRDGKSLDW